MIFSLSKRHLPTLNLNKGDAELIFYGLESVPDAKLVIELMERTVPFKDFEQSKWKMPSNCVIRDKPHFEGWIDAFTRVEDNELHRRFTKSEGRSFEIELLFSKSLSTVQIRTKLMTIGLGGYTTYWISITKIDEDEFICVE